MKKVFRILPSLHFDTLIWIQFLSLSPGASHLNITFSYVAQLRFGKSETFWFGLVCTNSQIYPQTQIQNYRPQEFSQLQQLSQLRHVFYRYPLHAEILKSSSSL